jgi:hypothetical protein
MRGEMNRDRHWAPTGDPSLVEKMRYLWELAAAIGRLCIPRGVRKYRSIEGTHADRELWETECVQLWKRMRYQQHRT